MKRDRFFELKIGASGVTKTCRHYKSKTIFITKWGDFYYKVGQ